MDQTMETTQPAVDRDDSRGEACRADHGRTNGKGLMVRPGEDPARIPPPAIRPGMCAVHRTAYDDELEGATVTNTDTADVTTTGGPRSDEDLPPSVRRKLEETQR